MDRKIPREICFLKDESESGEDDDDRPYSIFQPTIGGANDRELPVNAEPIDDLEDAGDDAGTVAPDTTDTADNISEDELANRVGDMDIADDGPPEGRALPDRGDIFYVPLAVYYYPDGEDVTVPEPEKNWHVKQRVTSARWTGKGKRRKFIIEAIDDFGTKYRREWDVFKISGQVKFNLRQNERVLQPKHRAWEIAGGQDPAISQLSLFSKQGPCPMLSLNSCAPKHVDQTAVRAFRESFPARQGTHTVKQLQAVLPISRKRSSKKSIPPL